jgi:hypothetical protein
MGTVRKNKIHNPQLVTENVPGTVAAEDFGRMWVDKASNKLYLAVKDTEGNPTKVSMFDSVEKTAFQEEIDQSYYKSIGDEYATIVAQTNGDKHYDFGFDFYSDVIFTQDLTQEQEDFYSWFYLEVVSTNDAGYLRTISTTEGDKHIRAAKGSDNYTYNSNSYKVVNYSKIILSQPVKSIVEIKFDNKDILEQGFELLSDGQTILIYCDPEGFFLNKTVKVRYLV